jgi:hypothetical protein
MSTCKSQRISYDKIPRMDYSRITEDLFIGTTPTIADYEHLRELDMRLVINVRWEFRPASPLLPLVERFR